VSIMTKARTLSPPAASTLTRRGSLCFKPLAAVVGCIAVISGASRKAGGFEVHNSTLDGCM